ncbi:MAG: pilus assembly PilX N-terminal domain-containing protein [Bacillota bacterium]
MKNLLKNEKGLALPLVLIVMLILTLLGTALWHYSTSEAMQVSQYEKRLQAHYLARSGAESLAAWINDHIAAQPEKVAALLAKSSLPVSLGNGTFAVSLEGTLNHITVKATGKVGNVEETVTIILNFTSSALPDPGNVASIFPEDFDFENGWKSGTDQVGGTGWVKSSTGHIKGGNNASSPEDPVIFPEEIAVEHQENQITYDFFAYYMLFENTSKSLYIKNGNTLRLHADILVFMGPVELRQAGGNYAELSLHVHPGYGVEIDGQLYGKVFFYGDVINNSGYVIIPRGAYYYRDNTIIRSTPAVIPPLTAGSLVPITGGGGSALKWE